MIRITRSLVLLGLSVLAALSFAVPATVASAAPATTITPWEAISFNVSTAPREAVLIIAGTLPEGTKLPVTVELAAPAGSTLQWAGEILGGDAGQDPEVEPVKTQRDGLDIYTFTVTKALTAQLEVATAPPVTMDGSTYVIDFSARSWTDAPVAGIAVQIPATAQLSETPTGTAGLAPGPTGYQYYSQDFTNVKNGDVLHVAFSYTLGTGAVAPAPAGSANSGGKLLIPILLVALVVAAGVGLVIGVRRKLGGGSSKAVAAPRSKPARMRAADASVSEDAFSDSGDVAEAPARAVAAPVETDGADDAVVPAAGPRSRLAIVGTLVIVGVLVAAGVVAGTQSGKARATGGVVSKTFSSGEACTNATIALALPSTQSAEQAAEQLFAALQTVPSITVATIDPAGPSLSVGFCDSQTNEAAIRAVLAPTGLVAAGGATTAPGDAGGSTGASTTVD